MYTFIGMDEAGYGPNLGPLIISATKWKLPDHPKQSDMWNLLETVLTDKPARKESRLHVADSKQVYSSTKGIRSLEKSVLVFLSIAGHPIESFQQIWSSVSNNENADTALPPWFHETDFPLPLVNDKEEILSIADKVSQCLDKKGIQLEAIRSDLVIAKRFNDRINQDGNKAITLTRLSLSLLNEIWTPADSTYVVADKHGGRNRYDEYLIEILNGEMIFRIDESREKSIYRIGESEIRFQAKAESHLPVALASMVSKYLRELSMELFNQFWIRHLPDLKPTKGYPQDARRYLAEIRETQEKMGIEDAILWRTK